MQLAGWIASLAFLGLSAAIKQVGNKQQATGNRQQATCKIGLFYKGLFIKKQPSSAADFSSIENALYLCDDRRKRKHMVSV
jgi:hypothetical protein